MIKEIAILKKLDACLPALEWVATQKDYKDAWQNCERGDWMLWLAKKLKVDDRKLTLAKFKCANQVRHLLEDQRSLAALDAAERYGNGEITREELNAAVAAAVVVAANAVAAAYAAAYAAVDAAAATAAATAAAVAVAANAVAAAAAAAYTAAADVADAAAAATYVADTADAAYAAARKESLKKSADICREVLTEEVLYAYRKIS